MAAAQGQGQGHGLLTFFTQMESQGGMIVRGELRMKRTQCQYRSLGAHANHLARSETPKLDLELHIANYGGRPHSILRLFLHVENHKILTAEQPGHDSIDSSLLADRRYLCASKL